jgi:hypothetical protein
MIQQALGQELYSAVLAVQGRISKPEALRLLALIIRNIKMRTGGMPAQVWDYPTAAGEGGAGQSIIQPCFTLVQPLVESLSQIIPGSAAIDTWQELDGFYVIVHSCRYFKANSLVRYLFTLGWPVLSWNYSRTRLAQSPTWWSRFKGFFS